MAKPAFANWPRPASRPRARPVGNPVAQKWIVASDDSVFDDDNSTIFDDGFDDFFDDDQVNITWSGW